MLRGVLLVIPALLLSPPGEPLDVDVFDASGLPSVVFDVTAPRDLAAEDLSSASVQVEGGSVESISPVDPTQVAVSLVIDDSPTMSREAVVAGQGASVELVRLTGEGTQISLSTPSGLLTALTTDRAANIARISGIVAGSPDVIPMPKLVLDAANRLAQAPERDRQLVVVLGTPFPAGPVLSELREVVLAAGIRLHVVTASTLDIADIAAVSAESGGITPDVPAPVGEIDAVTRTIADRYRVVATVDSAGPHEVTLTAGDRTYAGELDVVPPPPATAPATAAGTAAPTTAVTGTPNQAVTPNTATPSAVAPSASAGTTAGGESSDRPAGMGRVARLLGVFGLVVVVIAGWAVWIAVRNRSARHDTRIPAAPASPDGPSEAAAATDTPESVPGGGESPAMSSPAAVVAAGGGAENAKKRSGGRKRGRRGGARRPRPPAEAAEVQRVRQPIEALSLLSAEAPVALDPEPVAPETETVEPGMSNVEEPEPPRDAIESELSPVASIVPEPDGDRESLPLVPDLEQEPPDLSTLPEVAVDAPEPRAELLAVEPEPELPELVGEGPETPESSVGEIEPPVVDTTESLAAGAEPEAVEPEPDASQSVEAIAAELEPGLATIDMEAAVDDLELDHATAEVEVGAGQPEPERDASEPGAPEPIPEPATAVAELSALTATAGPAEPARRVAEPEAVDSPEPEGEIEPPSVEREPGEAPQPVTLDGQSEAAEPVAADASPSFDVLPESVARGPAGTAATAEPPPGKSTGERRPRRRSVLNDGPRHVSSRRTATESPAGVEVFDPTGATDAEPGSAEEMQEQAVRRRRGLPADRPRRPRTRRRFDDIPPIDAAEPPGTPPTS